MDTRMLMKIGPLVVRFPVGAAAAVAAVGLLAQGNGDTPAAQAPAAAASSEATGAAPRIGAPRFTDVLPVTDRVLRLRFVEGRDGADALDTARAARPDAYAITSRDDPGFRERSLPRRSAANPRARTSTTPAARRPG
jgi:hypothetical protein